MADTPLSYSLSSGQQLGFTFYYRQRTKLPRSDEVPNYWVHPRVGNFDVYPGSANGSTCGTNASWQHNWTTSIQFWDVTWEYAWTVIFNGFNYTYRPPNYPLFSSGYEALVYRPEGGINYFNSQSSLQEPQSQMRLEPLSSLGYPALTNVPTQSSDGIYWGDPGIGFKLVYPDGSQDVFNLLVYGPPHVTQYNSLSGGLTWQDSTSRAFLTQRIDPQGRVTQLGYERTAYTNFWQYQSYYNPSYYCWRPKYLVDPDGRTNTFVYPLASRDHPVDNPFQLAEINDPYGRKARLVYSSIGAMTQNTIGFLSQLIDAAGLTNSFSYQGNNGWISGLTTPYGTTSFLHYEVPDPDPNVIDGFQLRALYVTEPAAAHQLYLYQHVNSSLAATQASPTNVPGQTFDDGTAGADHPGLNYRNTFRWGRRQFAALANRDYIIGVLANGATYFGNALGALTANDYNKAYLKHWLVLGADQISITEALSSEQEPSPDAGGQTLGARTWYNYPNKPSPEQFGTTAQANCVARRLPDGTSQYTLFNYHPPGSYGAGLVSDNRSSFSQSSGLGVLTNWFDYAPNGVDLVRVSNSLGQFVTAGYSTNHQITRLTNALNQVTSLGWDANTHNLTNLSLPSGQTVTLGYYAASQPPARTSSLLRTVTLQPQGLTNEVADYTNGLPGILHRTGTGLPDLYVTNFWDGLNRLTAVAFPDGTTVSNIYDRLYPGAVKDRLNHWTIFTYDGLEHVTSVQDARTNVTQYSWCGCGSLESILDATGTNTTLFTYNNQGMLTNVLLADGASVGCELDSIGRVARVFDGANRSLVLGYNNQGLVTVVSNAYGLVRRVLYDAANRPIQVTDANGVTVTNSFDALDRLVQRAWPAGGGFEGLLWSARGLLAYTNQNRQETWFWRDEAGRVLGVTNANAEITRLAYNALDAPTDLCDGRNNHTGWGYNQYGWLTNKTDATREVLRLLRDANGQVTNRWTPQFGNTRYVRDANGNVVTAAYPQSTNSFTYDQLDRLATMADPLGTTVFSYTRAGQTAGEDGPWSSDGLTYSYVQGLRTLLSLQQPNNPAMQQSYGYDAAWRFQSVTSPAGTFGYSFNSPRSAFPTLLTLPNQGSITNHLDSLGRLDYTGLLNQWGFPLDAYSYLRDSLGLCTNVIRDLGLTTNTVAVGYDQVGQITSWLAKESGGALRLNEQSGWKYDAAGNLSFRTNGALVQTFANDSANQLTSITRSGTLTVSGATPTPASSVTVNTTNAALYGDFTFAATNLNAGASAFTIIAQNAYGTRVTNVVNGNLPVSVTLYYDSNGNLTNDGARSFSYDAENRLLTNWVTGAWKTEFVYDGLGRRRIERDYGWVGTWSKTNELHFVYDGWQLVQVRDANNYVLETYTRGLDLSGSLAGAGGIGGLLARTDGNGSLFYHADGAGNITALTDPAGNVNARYTYGPFGRLVGKWGQQASANRFRFSSKMHLPNAEDIYDYGWRNWLANPQRWASRDPAGEGGDINLYRGMFNSPLNVVDVDGRDNYVPSGYLNTQENFTGMVSIKLSQPPAVQEPLRIKYYPPPEPSPPMWPDGSLAEVQAWEEGWPVPGLQADPLGDLLIGAGAGLLAPRPGWLRPTPCPPRVHGNSLKASGPHDVYVIRDARTGRIYHFGETGRGYEVRGAEWVRKLRNEYGLDTVVERLATVEGKAAAKQLETRYITTYERVFGFKPGFVDATGNFVQIQRTAH